MGGTPLVVEPLPGLKYEAVRPHHNTQHYTLYWKTSTTTICLKVYDVRCTTVFGVGTVNVFIFLSEEDGK